MGAILMLGGVALEATAWTVGQLIGGRMLVGTGLIFGINAAPLLITELAYPTQRGKVTSLYNTMWYGGSIVAAWACLIASNMASNPIWSWRAPILIQALGPLLQIFLIRFVPESPRWLMSKGLEKEAARILARFHAVGFDERDPFVQYEMAQMRHALNMEKRMNKNASFASLFSTPGNRKRMAIILGLALFSQWSGNGLVSYYLKLVLESMDITNVRTQATINGCLQIWNLAAALAGALLVDKLGRRTLFIISNAGMLISLSAWTLTSSLIHADDQHRTTVPKSPVAKATIPFIFMFYLFYDLAYTPMLVTYTLEILPYAIRAKGFAVMVRYDQIALVPLLTHSPSSKNLTVSLALAISQFVDPWALDAIGWKYYLAYCGWLCFELVFVIIFIVETRGRTLEETAALFDGKDEPDSLDGTDGDPAIISRRGTTWDDDQDDDYIYTSKTGKFEAYELQRPKFVLQRDRLGHTKSRGSVFSYSGRV
ncbi:hypothetical protein BC826DRAFT_991422 [Russula brevipes]|nr:hypothetical protein BC826DRAFT_991422 [Russula brevipes]